MQTCNGGVAESGAAPIARASWGFRASRHAVAGTWETSERAWRARVNWAGALRAGQDARVGESCVGCGRRGSEMAAQKPTARRLGPSGAGSEQRGRAVGSAIQHGQVGRCLGAGAVGRGYAAWIEWGLEMSSNLYQGRLASRSGASGKR